jgi:hypothetical protein
MKFSHAVLALALFSALGCKDYKPEETWLKTVSSEQLVALRKTMLARDGDGPKKAAFILKHGQIQAKYAEKLKDLGPGKFDTWRRVRLLRQQQEEINDTLKALGFPELVRNP